MSNSTDTYDPNDISEYYVYKPSIGANAFFMAAFFLCGAILSVQSISVKRFYILIGALFCFSEGGGYLARLLFAQEDDPLKPKYLAQIIIIILAPNIIQAYCYKITAEFIHWSKYITEESFFKRYAARLPYWFVLIDFICLVIQGIAGGTLAENNISAKQRQSGKTTIMIGLALQLASLFIFTFVVMAFLYNTSSLERQLLTKYTYTLGISITLLIIRNAYRVAEFNEGNMTSGNLNKEEWYFFLADSTCMLIPVILMCIFSMAYLEEQPESKSDLDNSNKLDNKYQHIQTKEIQVQNQEATSKMNHDVEMV